MENAYGYPRNAKDVSLQELRDRLAEFARVRGWDQYHSPRNLLLALVSFLYILSVFISKIDILISRFQEIIIPC